MRGVTPAPPRNRLRTPPPPPITPPPPLIRPPPPPITQPNSRPPPPAHLQKDVSDSTYLKPPTSRAQPNPSPLKPSTRKHESSIDSNLPPIPPQSRRLPCEGRISKKSQDCTKKSGYENVPSKASKVKEEKRNGPTLVDNSSLSTKSENLVPSLVLKTEQRQTDEKNLELDSNSVVKLASSGAIFEIELGKDSSHDDCTTILNQLTSVIYTKTSDIQFPSGMASCELTSRQDSPDICIPVPCEKASSSSYSSMAQLASDNALFEIAFGKDSSNDSVFQKSSCGNIDSKTDPVHLVEEQDMINHVIVPEKLTKRVSNKYEDKSTRKDCTRCSGSNEFDTDYQRQSVTAEMSSVVSPVSRKRNALHVDGSNNIQDMNHENNGLNRLGPITNNLRENLLPQETKDTVRNKEKKMHASTEKSLIKLRDQDASNLNKLSSVSRKLPPPPPKPPNVYNQASKDNSEPDSNIDLTKKTILRIKVSVLELNGIQILEKKGMCMSAKELAKSNDLDTTTPIRAVVSFLHGSDVLNQSGRKIETNLTSLPIFSTLSNRDGIESRLGKAVWEGEIAEHQEVERGSQHKEKVVAAPRHIESSCTAMPLGSTFEFGRVKYEDPDLIYSETAAKQDAHDSGDGSAQSGFVPEYVKIPISLIKDGRLIPFGLATLVVTSLYRSSAEAEVMVLGVSSTNMSSFLHLTPKQALKIRSRMNNITNNTSFSFPMGSSKYKVSPTCRLKVRISVSEEDLTIVATGVPKTIERKCDFPRKGSEVNCTRRHLDIGEDIMKYTKVALRSLLRIGSQRSGNLICGPSSSVKCKPSIESPNEKAQCETDYYNDQSPLRLGKVNDPINGYSPDSVAHSINEKNVRFSQTQQLISNDGGVETRKTPRVEYVPFNPHAPQERLFFGNYCSSDDLYARSIFDNGEDIQDDIVESDPTLDKCEEFLGLTPFFEKVEYKLFGCHAGTEEHREFFSQCESYEPSFDDWVDGHIPRCRVLLRQHDNKMERERLSDLWQDEIDDEDDFLIGSDSDDESLGNSLESLNTVDESAISK